MLFNTVSYLLFLAVTVLAFWFTHERGRNLLLLSLSIVFYALWRVEFLAVIFVATLVDFFVALAIERSTHVGRRRLLLSFSVAVNLGFLIWFKYLGFLSASLVSVASAIGITISLPAVNIILPLGISFYTFEAISYVVDVYRGEYRAHRNYLTYAAFILFFPKLIAGPIMRAREIIPQLIADRRLEVADVWFAARRITLGLFLKVCVADNISEFVTIGFSQDLRFLSALDVWTLAFLFGLQIYFDFSAYSSIAIGSARLFAIHVPENFNYPYSAGSPREFWQRWHISLSSWIRDYLYIPLHGAVSSRGIALFLTWFVMGLWHGANWTFVLWGVMHAVYIAIQRLMTPLVHRVLPARLASNLGWAATTMAVMLAWIPFRAVSVDQTLSMLRIVATPAAYLALNLRENTYIVTAILFAAVQLAPLVRTLLNTVREQYPTVWQGLVFAAAFVVVPLVLTFLRPINQFIYFQF